MNQPNKDAIQLASANIEISLAKIDRYIDPNDTTPTHEALKILNDEVAIVRKHLAIINDNVK